jgi:hypothetical protein
VYWNSCRGFVVLQNAAAHASLTQTQRCLPSPGGRVSMRYLLSGFHLLIRILVVFSLDVYNVA